MSKDKKENENKQKPPVNKAKVYTMPSKFYTEDSSGNKKQGSNKILIMAIIFLVVAIGAGAAYFFLFKDDTTMEQPTNQAGNENNTNLSQNSNTNRNTNTNLSQNSNTNRNTNMAVNTNLNVNRNTNNDLFINDNKNTVSNFNINTEEVETGRDTDFDELTDVEEILYGTSSSLADTDADGFEDGIELKNGYDPDGEGKLENSSKVRFYSDSDYNYSVLYPTAWAVDSDPQNPGGKIFTSGDEFITVNVQENPAELSAVEWYVAKFPGINSSQIDRISNWAKTLSGALSLDGLTAYYTIGSKVYVISYNINILNEANYKATFEMLYKSFTNKVINNTNTNTGLNNNSVINFNANLNFNSNSNSNTNSNSNANSNINTNTNINTNNANRF